MQNKASLQTVVTLANAAELVVGIAQNVLGNDVADSVQGNVLNAEAVRSVALTQIQSEFSSTRGGN
jgi:formaldehyde-activating enzyme involved in methanogenesis